MPASGDVDDLISYGNLGLVRIINRGKFNPQVSRFATFASHAIHYAMLDGLKSEAGVSRVAREVCNYLIAAYGPEGILPPFNKFKQSMRETKDKLGKTERTFLEQASEETYVLACELYRNPNFVRMFTDIGRHAGDNNSSIDFLGDKDLSIFLGAVNTRGEFLEKIIERDEIFRLSRCLTKREQDIVQMYYGEEITMEGIARFLRISESRVFQIHKRILEKMRREASRLV